jgi:hypothetical protein
MSYPDRFVCYFADFFYNIDNPTTYDRESYAYQCWEDWVRGTRRIFVLQEQQDSLIANLKEFECHITYNFDNSRCMNYFQEITGDDNNYAANNVKNALIRFISKSLSLIQQQEQDQAQQGHKLMLYLVVTLLIIIYALYKWHKYLVVNEGRRAEALGFLRGRRYEQMMVPPTPAPDAELVFFEEAESILPLQAFRSDDQSQSEGTFFSNLRQRVRNRPRPSSQSGDSKDMGGGDPTDSTGTAAVPVSDKVIDFKNPIKSIQNISTEWKKVLIKNPEFAKFYRDRKKKYSYFIDILETIFEISNEAEADAGEIFSKMYEEAANSNIKGKGGKRRKKRRRKTKKRRKTKRRKRRKKSHRRRRRRSRRRKR